jgi:acyl carrier protein
MSTQEETFLKLKTIISEKLTNVDVEKIKPEASFIGDLGADSLDVVELVMAIEKDFGLEIPDNDADKIQTVQDAIYYIESHI